MVDKPDGLRVDADGRGDKAKEALRFGEEAVLAAESPNDGRGRPSERL